MERKPDQGGSSPAHPRCNDHAYVPFFPRLREFTRPQPEPRPLLILTPWEWSPLRSGLWEATGSFRCSPGDASRFAWEPRVVSAQSEAQGNLELRAVPKSVIIYSVDPRVGLSFFHSTS